MRKTLRIRRGEALLIVQNKSDKLLRLQTVLERVPVSRTTWFCGVRSGRFPMSVSLGGRSVAWRQSDIERVIAGTWQPLNPEAVAA